MTLGSSAWWKVYIFKLEARETVQKYFADMYPESRCWYLIDHSAYKMEHVFREIFIQIMTLSILASAPILQVHITLSSNERQVDQKSKNTKRRFEANKAKSNQRPISENLIPENLIPINWSPRDLTAPPDHARSEK